MGKRCQVRTITAEMAHAERLAAIPAMSDGERRARLRQIQVDLARQRHGQTYILSGRVGRKFRQQIGFAKIVDGQQSHLKQLRFLAEEAAALREYDAAIKHQAE